MSESDRQPDRLLGAFRVRFDEAAPDGRMHVGAVALCPGSRPGSTPRFRASPRVVSRWGLTWLARAAQVTVEADIGVGDELVGRPRSSVGGGSGLGAGPTSWTPQRTWWPDHVDWVLLDARGAPTRVPVTSTSISGPPRPNSAGSVALDDAPVDRPDPMRLDVRPQELDPMDASTMPCTRTGSTRCCSRAAADRTAGHPADDASPNTREQSMPVRPSPSTRGATRLVLPRPRRGGVGTSFGPASVGRRQLAVTTTRPRMSLGCREHM